MDKLEQLEKDYALVKAKGGRPELLQKLEVQIRQLKGENFPDTKGTVGLDVQFEAVFKEADDEIKRQYISGTDNFISKHHPDLNRELIEATDKMHEAWKKGGKGEARIDEFITALDEWKWLHLKAIEIYNEEREQLHLK